MPSLHLFLHLAAKEAGGLEQQHDDQDRKRNGVLPGGKADGGNEALAQADGDAADHRARNGTDASQNCGNEGFQAQHGTHGGRCLRVGAAIQHCADTGQRRTHRKGEGDGAVDVDAHQAGRIHILGDGAHGLAEFGLLDQEGQHEHGQHGDHQRDHGGQAHRHFAEVEGPGFKVGRDDLCTGAHQQLRRILQEEGHADGRDQQRDAGRTAQRGVGDLFDHHAQQGAGNDGGANSRHRAKAQLVHHEPGHVRAHHNDIAVGKVQQQDDAVHHAVAQCDQCIDAAQGKTVDQLTKKHCHGWILPFFAAFCHAFWETLVYQKSGDNPFRRSPQVVLMRGIRTFPSVRACHPHRSGSQSP